MRWTLALRHLLVRPGRAAVLLGGYAIGVAVMLVLLSVGDAMLIQSRDPALVGGGEVIAVPEGLDLEAIRTGGLGGMFLGIDRARFVSRQLVGGPRLDGVVTAVSPVLEEKLLTVSTARRSWPVRAGGEIPSAATALGAGLNLLAGGWNDAPADRRWLAPTADELLAALDRFHLPARPDSTWAEWQYYNVVVSEDEWWYVTLLVGGEVPDGRWGGRVLITRRAPGGSHRRVADSVAATAVRFDTASADLTIGRSSVTQRDGRWHLVARAGELAVDLEIVPAAHRYFPPVELSGGSLVSGYVVPALRATATGRVCVAGRCRTLVDRPAYHDHNWGIWRAVTWDWGVARGDRFDLLYGGVRQADGPAATGRAPFFLALVDSLGVRQVFRFEHPEVAWRDGHPAGLAITAGRGDDSLRLDITVVGSATTTGATGERFHQLRGRWRLDGRSGGVPVTDSGEGFFETWSKR